jgi:hypothetical protein
VVGRAPLENGIAYDKGTTFQQLCLCEPSLFALVLACVWFEQSTNFDTNENPGLGLVPKAARLGLAAD